MGKTLILIRHAHRDNSRRELDNGLSGKGRDQARAVREFFARRFLSEGLTGGLWLVSSPKQRCVETLHPIAKLLDRPLDVHPDLDEQDRRETDAGLESRVRSFLREWRQSQVELTVVCSHGDWIPSAIHQIFGLGLAPKKGSWFELEDGGDAPLLKWYIPTFKHFT